jgi:D-aminoacyl-tRNA deacylase
MFAAAKKGDAEQHAIKLADKVFRLRIFNDEQGKMNLSLKDLLGAGETCSALAISNFTLYGETAKNRRPSFVDAAPYDEGERLFQSFVTALAEMGVAVEQGIFGADMKVLVENDGPVTVILDV